MKDITPLLPYADERKEWLEAVLPAMKKEQRQIILAQRDGALAGFLQYYINGELLMIEEVQLKECFRSTSLILRFARFLCTLAGEGVRFVEAYAHRLNTYSRAVIASLGMKEIGEISDIGAIHYRVDAAPLIKRFRKIE